jgi:hypothetical protein
MNYANIVFPDINVVRYVVIHEAMLGYIMPHNPLNAQILRDRYHAVGVSEYPLSFTYLRTGEVTTFTGYKDVRPATIEDFNTFRVAPPPIFKDDRDDLWDSLRADDFNNR